MNQRQQDHGRRGPDRRGLHAELYAHYREPGRHVAALARANRRRLSGCPIGGRTARWQSDTRLEGVWTALEPLKDEAAKDSLQAAAWETTRPLRVSGPRPRRGRARAAARARTGWPGRACTAAPAP